jgi:hypothetical protein
MHSCVLGGGGCCCGARASAPPLHQLPAPSTHTQHPQGAKKITYAQFSTALDLIAAEKHTSRQALDDALLCCGGPAVNSTNTVTPALDLLRMHDNAGAAW